MRSSRILVGMVLALVAAGTGASFGAPAHHHNINTPHYVAPGITYEELRTSNRTTVHVVTVSPNAPTTPMVAVANNQIAGPVHDRLEQTSKVCRKQHCVVAMNGDYFCTTVYCPRDVYQPQGGVISNGRLLRSPYSIGWQEQQLMLNRQGCPLSPKRLRWLGEVKTGGKSYRLSGVNVDRHQRQLVLYTAAYGPRTGTKGGVDLRLKLSNASWQGDLNRPVKATPLRVARSNSRIRPGTVVLSGRGKTGKRLRALWFHDSSVTLSLTTNQPVWNSIGAKPLLLKDGHYTGQWRQKPANPITVFAWKPDCTRFLIAADGREGHNVGLTNPQAAKLAKSLGATTAFGLDGGGSTTLVASGRVMNQPSDQTASGRHIERPVADALLFVFKGLGLAKAKQAVRARPSTKTSARPSPTAKPTKPAAATQSPAPTSPQPVTQPTHRRRIIHSPAPHHTKLRRHHLHRHKHKAITPIARVVSPSDSHVPQLIAFDLVIIAGIGLVLHRLHRQTT